MSRVSTKPTRSGSSPWGGVEVVTVGSTNVTRGTLEPGWRWSECVKPIAGTESCQVPHDGYAISGQLRIFQTTARRSISTRAMRTRSLPGHDATVDRRRGLRGRRLLAGDGERLRQAELIRPTGVRGRRVRRGLRRLRRFRGLRRFRWDRRRLRRCAGHELQR